MTPLIPARVETQRLVLRTWRPKDRPAFAVINADPAVTEHVSPMPLSRGESDALVDRIEASWLHRGYGLYAVEDRDSGQLLGYLERFSDATESVIAELPWIIVRLDRSKADIAKAKRDLECADAFLRFFEERRFADGKDLWQHSGAG